MNFKDKHFQIMLLVAILPLILMSIAYWITLLR